MRAFRLCAVLGMVSLGLAGCGGLEEDDAQLAMEKMYAGAAMANVQMSNFEMDNCEEEDDGHHCDVSGTMTITMDPGMGRGNRSDSTPIAGRFRFAEMNGSWKAYPAPAGGVPN